MKTSLKHIYTSRKKYNIFFLGIMLGFSCGLALALVIASYIQRAPKPIINHGNKTQNHNAKNKEVNTDINHTLIGTRPGVSLQIDQNKTTVNSNVIRQTKRPYAPKILEVTNEDLVKQNIMDDNNQNNYSVNHFKNKSMLPHIHTSQSSSQNIDYPNIKITYFLQIGAFKTAEDAEKQRAELAFTGLKVNSIDNKHADGLYHVRLGPFDEKTLHVYKKNLEQAQIKYMVIRSTQNLQNSQETIPRAS